MSLMTNNELTHYLYHTIIYDWCEDDFDSQCIRVGNIFTGYQWYVASHGVAEVFDALTDKNMIELHELNITGDSFGGQNDFQFALTQKGVDMINFYKL